MAKKVALIIAQKDFHDEEYSIIKEVLFNRGMNVLTVAKTRDKAHGRMGLVVKPDLAIAEIEEKNFDALVFVGGIGCRDYLADKIALDLIYKFKKAGKILSASCLAPSILANAGALVSKIVTAFPTEEENLKNKGAEYTGMPLEVDNNIITCKDPADAKALGLHLAYLLEG